MRDQAKIRVAAAPDRSSRPLRNLSRSASSAKIAVPSIPRAITWWSVPGTSNLAWRGMDESYHESYIMKSEINEERPSPHVLRSKTITPPAPDRGPERDTLPQRLGRPAGPAPSAYRKPAAPHSTTAPAASDRSVPPCLKPGSYLLWSLRP